MAAAWRRPVAGNMVAAAASEPVELRCCGLLQPGHALCWRQALASRKFTDPRRNVADPRVVALEQECQGFRWLLLSTTGGHRSRAQGGNGARSTQAVQVCTVGGEGQQDYVYHMRAPHPLMFFLAFRCHKEPGYLLGWVGLAWKRALWCHLAIRACSGGGGTIWQALQISPKLQPLALYGFPETCP